MNAALSHAPVPDIGRANSSYGKSFAEILSEATARAALNHEDRPLQLAELHFTSDGTLEVPRIGPLEFTTWSRTQLSRMLGIRWERWFADIVSPDECADEVNRRLKRQTATRVKIRSRRYSSAEPGKAAGILRGFVGPQYAPIDDVRILGRLAEVLGEEVEHFRFVRVERTDRSSYYVALSTNDLDLGNGEPDPHRSGLLVRNSEVGATAVSIFEYLFRLVCTNGLVVQVAGKALFYRVHRQMGDQRLDEALYAATFGLTDRWNRTAAMVRAARGEQIADPEDRIRTLLEASADTRRHIPAVLASYAVEPEATRFGIIQAVTRAARDLYADGRFALEAVAGSQLSS